METIPEPDFMNVSGAQESILTASLAGQYDNPMGSLNVYFFGLLGSLKV